MSYGGHFLGFAREFLDVAAAYDRERGITADMNTLYECDEYAVRYQVPLDDCCPEWATTVLLTCNCLCSQRWPKWIDKESGRRSDPAHHYIYNQAANTNLQLIADARVVRVLFEYVERLFC